MEKQSERQSGKQYRDSAVRRQRRLREKNRAVGKRQINVWLDATTSNRLARLKKKLGHASQAETITAALKALEDRIRMDQAEKIRQKVLQTAKSHPLEARNG